MQNADEPAKRRPDDGEEAVKPLESARLLARILDVADDAVISTDDRGRVVLFNQGAERIFGYTEDEIVGRPLDTLIPERYRHTHDAHIEGFGQTGVSARAMAERGEIFGLRKSGEEFPAEASISQVELQGRKIFTAILRDVSTRREIETSLRDALREKETLLREVHHRVKNNLQVVSSLLNLQSRAATDEEVVRAFVESQQRVQSMALIHEQLYESPALADIDFPDYIRRLANRLFRSYQIDAERVRLEAAVDEAITLGVDSAVPCGLIVNELISNSLKHAFPGERDGLVTVKADQMPDGSVLLVVADDGVGLPPEIGFWNTKTLGLRLVRSLVRQLDGEIELNGSAGTEFRIRFATEGERA